MPHLGMQSLRGPTVTESNRLAYGLQLNTCTIESPRVGYISNGGNFSKLSMRVPEPSSLCILFMSIAAILNRRSIQAIA
jgi:hypothetical protein